MDSETDQAMSMTVRAALCGLAALAFTVGAHAASLQVSPTTVEVVAPAAAATIKLRNDETRPITAQVRVFRWSVVDGKERLDPTDFVVVSPPIVSLSPRTDYVVRIVRTSRQPVSGEESYRLLVDELPDAKRMKSGAVNLLLRYSLPVFFGAPDRGDAKLKWLLEHKGGQLWVSAQNLGDRRMRISRLGLKDASGQAISFGEGLNGYVLARSTMSWAAPKTVRGFGIGGTALISAQSDLGRIDASAQAQ
ncbi:MAG TPA: molecular chaperone [Hyphomicrobiaceae bacterium]|nr:molecular chaperone [Hyphomicrobiaceae bacterium]